MPLKRRPVPTHPADRLGAASGVTSPPALPLSGAYGAFCLAASPQRLSGQRSSRFAVAASPPSPRLLSGQLRSRFVGSAPMPPPPPPTQRRRLSAACGGTSQRRPLNRSPSALFFIGGGAPTAQIHSGRLRRFILVPPLNPHPPGAVASLRLRRSVAPSPPLNEERLIPHTQRMVLIRPDQSKKPDT